MIGKEDITAFADTLVSLANAAGPGAAIVAGDLNASSDMQPFRRLLDSGFRNAAEQAGAGSAPSRRIGRGLR